MISKNAIFFFFIFANNAFAINLDEAFSQSIANSYKLKSINLQKDANEENYKSTWKNHLPKLTASAGETWLKDQVAFNMSVPSLHTTLSSPLIDKRTEFLSLKVTVPVFTSGKISYYSDYSKKNWESSQLDSDILISNLKLDVANSYVNVLRAQKALSLAKNHLESLNQHLINVEKMYSKGIVAKSDLLMVKTAKADADQKVFQAENAVQLSKSVLNRLIGNDLDAEIVVEELNTSNINSSDLKKLMEQAKRNRKELSVLEKKSESLNSLKKASYAESLPQVFVSGGYDHLNNSHLNRNDHWSVTAGVTMDIFDFGKNFNKGQEYHLKSLAIAEEKNDANSLIELQVKDAYLNLNESQKRINVAKEAVNQAEESLKEIKARYKASLSTNTDVLNSETFRVLSITNLDNANYDSIYANLKLKRAIGEL